MSQDCKDRPALLDRRGSTALTAGMELMAAMVLMAWTVLLVLTALLVHVVLTVCRDLPGQRAYRAHRAHRARTAYQDQWDPPVGKAFLARQGQRAHRGSTWKK